MQFLSLNDVSSGTYDVETESAVYTLDLDNAVVTRHNKADFGGLRTMRNDHQPTALLRVDQCTVGRAMILVINLGVKEVSATFRISTPVRQIRRTETS
ncbi:MAG: hypothetical protein IR160_03155 [Salinibacterium sp.]|nr:hypothetical protein [Salinibacterium sp.]MBF0671565.1 hypothetical protein [Salinibacterium sp.]